MRLYRPFSADAVVAALPKTVRAMAVLDRTKEPGSVGEPLYLDVVAALAESIAAAVALRPAAGDRRPLRPLVEGVHAGDGRGGAARATVEQPKRHFTVGIRDDVTHMSIATDTDSPPTARGRGAGAVLRPRLRRHRRCQKSSVKIIGENTDLWVQGYFVYDSKKAGSVTVSHLRFGPKPIRSSYLITDADFIACHQFSLLGKMKVLDYAKEGATFLLNSPYPADASGTTFPAGPAADDRQAPALLGDRRRRDRARGRPGQPHQHGDAACFFELGRFPRRRRRSHQGVGGEDLRRCGPTIVERNFAAIDRSRRSLPASRCPSGHKPRGSRRWSRRAPRLRKARHGAAPGRRR